jgi:RNA 3'-terminal phosphate cyclase (ATP)
VHHLPSLFHRILNATSRSVDIGSQGSCALVVQAILPVMIRAPCPSTFSIDGGTHVSFAPPYQALQHVVLPLVRRFGAVVSCECQAISLYRSGTPSPCRGRLLLSVAPSLILNPLHLLELGCISSVHCWCVSDAACSAAAAAALAACADAAATAFPGASLHCETISSDEAAGSGPQLSLSACIGLCASSSTGCVLGADRMLLNMRPNDGGGGPRASDGLQMALEIVEEVVAAVRVGACVDHRACDQLPVFMSLAAGPSRVRVQRLSDHARSACVVASKFTGAVFDVESCENGCVFLSCTPPFNPLASDAAPKAKTPKNSIP